MAGNNEWIMYDGLNDCDSISTDFTSNNTGITTPWEMPGLNLNIDECQSNFSNDNLYLPDLEMEDERIDNLECVGTACTIHTPPAEFQEEGLFDNYPKREQFESIGFKVKNNDITISSRGQNTNWPVFIEDREYLDADSVFKYVSLGGYLPTELLSKLNCLCADAIYQYYYPENNIDKVDTTVYPYNNVKEYELNYNPIIGAHVYISFYQFRISDYAILAKTCIDFMIKNKGSILY